VENFHPHTGAYWAGYEHACDGREPCPPEEWDSKAKADYAEGYEQAVSELAKDGYTPETWARFIQDANAACQ